ncbi:putative uridine nucleosidase 2 [Zea mays]|uniref:uridine nucleosidase n=1 Tax=Zea mays TaxID=4577 RepID=A0A3L6FG56_MAIZE|nr:putative uridine nucleosidase 2 [Zea mays]
MAAVEGTKKKVIIDTDPGIDDAMAIFLALRSPELEVLGLTTTFGNVHTALATRNALHLVPPPTFLPLSPPTLLACSAHSDRGSHLLLMCVLQLEAVGRTDIPVAEGSHVTIKKATKLRIASFVHGSDGLGNQDFPPPATKPVDQSAAAFLVEQANLYPGQVSVVALGPLTNLALAVELDPAFPEKIGQIIILGGAYSVNGNVNPAAEANIFGDPDAADIVFTCGADILAVGLNVTHQVVLTDADREKLEQCDSKYARYLCKLMGVYFDYHRDAYFIKGAYLHDPTTVIAAVNPSLLTYTEGVVRVQTVGITKGLTVFDNTKKRYGEITAWSGMPTVKVAVTVDAPAVVELIVQRLMTDD